MQLNGSKSLWLLSGVSVVVGVLAGWAHYQVTERRPVERMVPEPTASTKIGSQAESSGADSRTYVDSLRSYLVSVPQISGWEALMAETMAWRARPLSTHRAFALEALLSRVFEEYPESALPLVMSLDLHSDLLTRIFRSWVDVDPDRALALLDQIDDPWTERRLALAILQASGDGVENVEQLVAAGRSLDAVSLRLAYVAWLSETGRETEAVAKAMSLKGVDAKRLALQGIARRSPHSASLFALAATIGDSGLRTAFLSELYRQWSRNDVTTFLDHLSDLDPRDPFLASTVSSGLLFAAEYAPEQALDAASALRGPLRLRAMAVALESVAAQDPQAALARLRSIAEQSHPELLEAIATGYARFDLEGALSWLSTLSEAQAQAAGTPVLSALAAVDLEEAIDLRLDGVGGNSLTWLEIPMKSDLSQPAYLADKIFSSDDDMLLTVLLRRWAASEPYDAVAWMQNKRLLPTQAIQSVAQEVAQNSIRDAFGYMSLLNSEQRAAWAPSAASAGAFYDPAETISALRPFERESFYDQAMWAALTVIASRDGPRRAAELAGSAPSPMAAAFIARRWADDSPRDAGAWALSLSDPEARTSTVETVAEAWIRNDPESASRWITGLTDTVLRTRVLSRVCRGAPEITPCG